MSILHEPQCEAPHCGRFGRDRVEIRLPTGHPWRKHMKLTLNGMLALKTCPPCAGRATDIYPAWPTADKLAEPAEVIGSSTLRDLDGKFVRPVVTSYVNMPLDRHLELVVQAWNKFHNRPANVAELVDQVRRNDELADTPRATLTDGQSKYLRELVNSDDTDRCVRLKPAATTEYRDGRYHVQLKCSSEGCKNHGCGRGGSFRTAAHLAVVSWNVMIAGSEGDE